MSEVRLIDANALKEKISEYVYELDGTIFDEILYGVIDNAPTIEGEILTKEAYSDLCLRASKERTQGEWIPVSERLPEKNGFYITTCRDICENRVHTVMFDGVRKKWGRGGVIAWQPLPEPYKKGGAE